ncbi:MAG: hypothetical protein MJ147_05610 [Clostridia bacterium]|nr:hypothetical protein [Clostridia bacterium]
MNNKKKVLNEESTNLELLDDVLDKIVGGTADGATESISIHCPNCGKSDRGIMDIRTGIKTCFVCGYSFS